MSNWKIIVPQAATNMTLNPSAEIAGNYTAEAGTTVTRVTTYQKYGLYSYRVQTDADNEGVELTLSALSNAFYYVTMCVAGTLPASWDWSLDDANYHTPALLGTIDTTWSVYGYYFSSTEANGSTKLSIHQNGAGGGDFYLDGIQVELGIVLGDYYTTYCDGTQEGCEWNGAAHGSTSTRSALSRAGGVVLDLQDWYQFYISGVIGAGVTGLDLGVDEYAMLPGGELNSIKEKYRVFTITGTLMTSSVADLHSQRKALLDALSKDAVPQTERGYQPIRLRYTGGAVQKEIAVHYDKGLEVNIEAAQPISCSEQIALSFVADDPYWYELGNSAAVLDSNDDISPMWIMEFDKVLGKWVGLVNGIDHGVWTLEIATNGTLYAGGEFSVAGGDAANFIAWWDGTIWTALTDEVDGACYILKFGPDGTLYAGGAFTHGGAVEVNYFASWDGVGWTSYNDGFNGSVLDIAISPIGEIYVAGSFTQDDGGNPLVGVAMWDGAAWVALGAGVNGWCYSLDFAPDGTLYVGGAFTTAGGAPANRIAAWDGTNWTPLGTGLNDTVSSLKISKDGIVYVGGLFTTAGGITVNYVAVWDGSSWNAMGSGVNDTVYRVGIGSGVVNDVYLGGYFTNAGDIDLADLFARWNGYTYSHAGFNIVLGGAATRTTDIIFSNPDFMGLYNIYASFTGGAGNTAYTGETNTVTNNGVIVYPVACFHRDGGTSATIQTLLSATTGKEILFNYELQDGETLTIDLKPKTKNITSNFFGQKMNAILANSDFGDFSLLPGYNIITAFVDIDGATVTAWLQWRTAYASWD